MAGESAIQVAYLYAGGVGKAEKKMGIKENEEGSVIPKIRHCPVLRISKAQQILQ